MNTATHIQTVRHCAYLLHAHFVFVTKYRHSVLPNAYLMRTETIIGDPAEAFGCTIVGFNGEPNHVHLLITYPPTVALSTIAHQLKGSSSRFLRNEYPELKRHYSHASQLWDASHFVGSIGGVPLSVIRQHIEHQNRPRWTIAALHPR